MDHPLLSIIIPVYNTGNYIEKCLSSILEQTYSNLELLVVNDASPDDASERIFCSMWKEYSEVFRQWDEEKLSIRVELQKENDKFSFFLVFDTADVKNDYFYLLNELVQKLCHETIECGSYQWNPDGMPEPISSVSKSPVFDEISVVIREDCYVFSGLNTRIKYLCNLKNKGLFHARLTGYEFATGDYIGSVDSDDYIGVDYYRLLVKKALETNADVVFSTMVKHKVATNYMGIRTHGNQAVIDLDLQGEEILNFLFESEGELSFLWFVWNKLYKKELWDRSYETLKTVEGHHIMLEDLMFGIVFMSKAKRYVYADVDTYFYTENAQASTSRNGGMAKLSKNISDVLYAFQFIENYLKELHLLDTYQEKLDKIEDKWSRTWHGIVETYKIPFEEKEKLNNQLLRLSSTGELTVPTDRDVYFYDLFTPWDNRLEKLKTRILDPKIEIISFDIFDTLIVRPFYRPADLFILLNPAFEELTCGSGMATFSELRILAEKYTRYDLEKKSPQFQDITLDEIYQTMENEFQLSHSVVQKMKDLEIEYEIRYCTERKKLKELYELAVYAGKRVIAVSDMYLSKDVIETILSGCGYQAFEKIYLSGEIRLTKSSGDLFQYVLNDLSTEGKVVLHIGDNWKSDCEKAADYGIESWRTAKPIELLMNQVADMNKKKGRSSAVELLERNSPGNYIRYVHARDYFGIRCMLGVVANSIFDHPYLSYESNTDFNRNPYYMGFFALGMHSFGIVLWLIRQCYEKKPKTVHFVARDGYLLKQIFEMMKNNIPALPATNYFYMSRKSFLPLTIETRQDFYRIGQYVSYLNKSGAELLSYFQPFLPDDKTMLEEDYFNRGILLYQPLKNERDYRQFIQATIEILYDEKKIADYRSEMKKHFHSIFSEGDLMFDIGYSGRAQAILSKLLGYGVNACYIHTLQDNALEYGNRYHFEIFTYYDYTPSLTGKVRELVQMEPGPSCIGYTKKEPGKYVPVFEEMTYGYHEIFLLKKIQQGAVDFVETFMRTFHDHLSEMRFRKTDISFAFEKFMLNPRNADMQMFRLFHIEDDLLFDKNYQKKRLVDIWRGDLEWQGMWKKSNKSSAPMTSAAEQNYIPIVSKDYAPNGRGKLRYYLTNDHLLLRKHMYSKYGGASVRYRMFEQIYHCAKTLHHTGKKLNLAGNKKEHFRLNPNGKILYSATSSYGLLCCMLHKMKYHPEEESILLLSVWRKDKLKTVRETEIFETVILWNDLELRKIDEAMNVVLKNGTPLDYEEQEWRYWIEYEKKLPFRFGQIKEIIIAGNTMPLGCYLERNQVPYSAIEDGAGVYSDPSLLQHSISCSYPLLEQYMIQKYKIFQKSQNRRKNYINAAAQKRAYTKKNTVDFQPVKITQELEETDRKKVLRVFEVKEARKENKRKSCLILTYPLAQREKLTIQEERAVYTLFADIFASEYEEYHIKPHPDDRTDFSDIADFRVINKMVLSELLWYETKTVYPIAISAVSTSLNNLTCIKQGILFSERFTKEYQDLLLYYIIGKLIAVNKPESNLVSVTGIYLEMLENIFSYSDLRTFGFKVSETAVPSPGQFILVGRDKTNTVVQTLQPETQRVIWLGRPTGIHVTKITVSKTPLKGKSTNLSLEKECFYVSGMKSISLPDQISLKVSGIIVSLHIETER